MERIGWPLNRPPIPKYKDGSTSKRFNTYYSDKDNEMKIPFATHNVALFTLQVKALSFVNCV